MLHHLGKTLTGFANANKIFTHHYYVNVAEQQTSYTKYNTEKPANNKSHKK